MNALLKRLPILVLEPHSRCNCRCVMCDIWKIADAREITAAELERHLADIERLGVEWVVFTGGEPLMHSDLFRLSALLRARGVRTTILSTGLLLERFAGSIANGVDEVIVSLDGPAAVHDLRIPGNDLYVRFLGGPLHGGHDHFQGRDRESFFQDEPCAEEERPCPAHG